MGEGGGEVMCGVRWSRGERGRGREGKGEGVKEWTTQELIRSLITGALGR